MVYRKIRYDSEVPFVLTTMLTCRDHRRSAGLCHRLSSLESPLEDDSLSARCSLNNDQNTRKYTAFNNNIGNTVTSTLAMALSKNSTRFMIDDLDIRWQTTYTCYKAHQVLQRFLLCRWRLSSPLKFTVFGPNAYYDAVCSHGIETVAK